MGSEDFSDIANGVGAPYCYWLFGGSDPAAFATAFAAGTVATDIPSNHSPRFAPVIQPTLNTGTAPLVAAAMAWLGKDAVQRCGSDHVEFAFSTRQWGEVTPARL
jgi:hippurate hydrolase